MYARQQLVRVAVRAKQLISDAKSVAQLGDQLVLVREVGIRARDRLQLEEGPETFHLVQVDAQVPP